MRKIGVHLEDELVTTLQRPSETMYISRAEALLSAPLFDEQLPRILLLQTFDDRTRAIRRAVVNNKDMEPLLLRKDRLDHARDVVFFVVCGYDN